MMRVALGVTGGIAAYKSCEIASRLRKRGCEVTVVMTKNARQFVTPVTFETLTGNRVYDDQFDRAFEIGHIALAKWADIMLIAPATANIIGKMAAGIADDLLSTSLMAATAPVVMAPAMNCAMWKCAANQENIETLKRRGVEFIGPAVGRLACGDDDIGRMSEPDEIVEAVVSRLNRKHDLEGRCVLVTAGPTRELIDPVRFLSNRSSGKMGFSIAEAARDRGADVTLLAGAVSLDRPSGVKYVSFTSTDDLYKLALGIAPECDAVIQSAAPADFTPKTFVGHKIKKTGDGMTIELVSTPDVAKALGERKRPGQVLVAFAAETDDLIDNAKGKLARKNADIVVANDVTQPDAGFAVDTNRVVMIDGDGVTPYPLMSKREVADALLDRVAKLLSKK